MLKVWRLAFQSYQEPSESAPARLALGPVWVLVGISLLVATVAGPVYEFAEATAAQLLDAQTYGDAVLSETIGPSLPEVPGS
jgi:formate hydrogenlyase subunit 3/multisubunit Na+/H+ antiporter MnhD subunit